MNVITYALFAYVFTAIISLLLIGVIVSIDKFMSRNSDNREELE